MIRKGFWPWLLAVSLGTFLGLWFCAGDRSADAFAIRESRTYHVVSIAQLAQTRWTHVHVCGLVSLVKTEGDGDVHIRLSDPAGRFAVAEIIPAIPLSRPQLRQRICVDGLSRFDKVHGWPEVHPVEHWRAQ